MTPAPMKEIGWFPIELTAAAQAHPSFQDWPSQAGIPVGRSRYWSSISPVSLGELIEHWYPVPTFNQR
ncbi:MAG: hypothetical protein P3X23_004870 [Thermosynechococcus sp. Uc]|uniref:hypothetical protein n=1 Tax=Thermosynechococcus sp. Uc TaxID=3034853 RepID=UPI00259F0CB5|nr:hypothetical protein [Thermosynechococcus sp. Uc]MDM7326437.1 hypothetical protein [Thermosynechococcus sp. Uc]